jgi:protein-tyrosine phosphatase
MANTFRDFAEITDNGNLIVGSQPRSTTDIDSLVENGVKAIESLQERSEDLSYFNEKEYCDQKGIAYERVPIHDRDRKDVRTHLPVAVGILDKAIEKLNDPKQRVYLHCHAGRGRSPSVAAAYLYWFKDDIDLDWALDRVKRQRTNSTPYDDAIRGATYDILERNNGPDKFQEFPQKAFSDIKNLQKGTIREYVKRLPGNAWP